MNRIVFITGATSGIGEAAAVKFAANGWNVIINGRRADRLEKLAKRLTQQYSVDILPLAFDVSDNPAVERAITSLSPPWQNIDVLINNAGGAKGLGPVQDGNLEDWEWMIDVNVKGLLYVSRMVIPLMQKQHEGRIINIGSIAGRDVYPNGNVYCAAKAAADMLSRGMRVDLLKEGIKVTHVAPGAANTEFSLVRFKGDQEKADNVYTGYQPMSGDDVADVLFFIGTLPSYLNINDIEIVPAAQAGTNFVHRKISGN